MFGTSGIRGSVGEELTADLALAVGQAIGTDAARVVIGRDPRASGRFLENAIAAGCQECGADMIHLGIAATPTIARSVGWLDADVGVAVTASHNPPEDNGIKLWQPSGQAFNTERRNRISTRVTQREFDRHTWDAVGSKSHWKEANQRHKNVILDTVDIDTPHSLSVIVDIGNGSGGITADILLELGCSVETLNAQPDGRFPGRPSEPTPENCRSLCSLVEATDADIGIAHDGDADRMLAVTDTGRFVPGDILLGLFGRETVQENERIAVPIDTSQLVTDMVGEVGGTVTYTKVGDVYVAERATEPEVVFGGEPSGAWIWPDETLCPDGPLAAAKLVELVSEYGPLSSLLEDIAPYPIHRENYTTTNASAVMNRIEETTLGAFDDVELLDGVRVNLDDGWLLIRASGTQPLIRVTAEASDEDRATTVFETARSIVEDAL